VKIVAMLGIAALSACAAKAAPSHTTITEEGLNNVRVEPAPSGASYSHPASLTPHDMATILRGVRVWEQRNVVHRLYAGDAPKIRAFRDEEISFLAPALSAALREASPTQRVYFHLAHADPQGAEETSSGWLFIEEPDLHLVLSEVHDRHAPGPDISKYDRRMPDVPEVPGAFNATFEPEEYLAGVRSGFRWFAPDQREELLIRYHDALPALPAHPLSPRPDPDPAPRKE
jgi:hypothetical protein